MDGGNNNDDGDDDDWLMMLMVARGSENVLVGLAVQMTLSGDKQKDGVRLKYQRPT